MAKAASDMFDVAIIGGGMVGASLAAALGQNKLRVAMVEAFPQDAADQPAYDERTVALTWSARQIFSGIGIWQDVAGLGAEPIIDIHVSNRGRFGATHLSASDVGTEALGYVVPTRTIGKVLGDRLNTMSSVTRFQPAIAEQMEADGDIVHVALKGDDLPATINARLLVLADGGRSKLSDAFEADKQSYTQQALLCIVSCDRPHNGRAYERFTEEGPIALLPHSDRRYAVVWTGEADRVADRLGMDDPQFIDALQLAFGDRAGNLSRPSERKAWPLQRAHIDNPTGNRTIVVGNAAHTVHPVAGQGFNLGLRDVAWLAELVSHAASQGDDIGGPDLLDRYTALRSDEAKRVSRFTHGLISVFSSSFPGASLARNAALTAIEHLPPVKRLLLRRTMGMNGRASALASGDADV